MKIIRNIIIFILLWLYSFLAPLSLPYWNGIKVYISTYRLILSNVMIIPIIVTIYIIVIVVISIFFSCKIVLDKNSKFNFVMEVIILILTIFMCIVWFEKRVYSIIYYYGFNDFSINDIIKMIGWVTIIGYFIFNIKKMINKSKDKN